MVSNLQTEVCYGGLHGALCTQGRSGKRLLATFPIRSPKLSVTPPWIGGKSGAASLPQGVSVALARLIGYRPSS